VGIKQYQLLIKGRVQGVGYRVSAAEKARQLDLVGWVRNLADGRVELCIEGEQEPLQQMIDWARQGPRFAEVTHIDLSEKDSISGFLNFDIR
jgi:acylphosphatase